jgi:aflatoxin B1 aldehyde reductase
MILEKLTAMDFFMFNDKIPLVLGTMNFGPQVDIETAKLMTACFLDAGFDEIDSAYVYNEGETEKIIGAVLPDFTGKTIHVATKVHPRITGRLDGEAVTFQFSESLKRMGQNRLDVLYFHFPDIATPIDDALEACMRLYEQGKIKELGLSNFPAWKVVDVWHLCDKHGWIKPTVYQGMYNGLCRNVEDELFPALRHLGMRFYAYNPLAGGILTGKHRKFEEEPLPGRFSRLESYRKRYWKKSYFDAVNILLSACRQEDITPSEAAFRWLVNHSCLDKSKRDGIVVGASSLEQLKQNIASAAKGSLPDTIMNAFDDAWSEAKAGSPEYFQFFPK